MAGRFLSLTGPLAPRVVVSPSWAMRIKSALRDLLFCIIRHDKHSSDWLAALAAPYPAAPDFPLFRGQNKTPRNILFISISTVSTGCCAPSKRGKGGGASHQRGNAFPRLPGRLLRFFIKGRLLSIHRCPPPPFEPSEPFEPRRRRRLNPLTFGNAPQHRYDAKKAPPGGRFLYVT